MLDLTTDNLYTDNYLKFVQSTERTGLLYEVALGLFNSGQFVISDGCEKMFVPIVTNKEWIANSGDYEINSQDKKIDDINGVWMDRVFKRLDYQGAGEIWNGDVCQVQSISDNCINLTGSNYFTLASHREKYVSDVAREVYTQFDEQFSPQKRHIDQLQADVYSLIGVTYTVVINSKDSDSKWLIYGQRSDKANELASFRTVCPAGIVQPRHTNGESHITDVVENHFVEEFPEEVLHEVLKEAEFKKYMNTDQISYTVNGIGLDPLRYSTEVACSVEITGDLAEFVMENMYPNEEMETLNTRDITEVSSIYDSLFARGLTPQSLFSVGLYLSNQENTWDYEMTNNNSSEL